MVRKRFSVLSRFEVDGDGEAKVANWWWLERQEWEVVKVIRRQSTYVAFSSRLSALTWQV